jgi:hypothetical protein
MNLHDRKESVSIEEINKKHAGKAREQAAAARQPAQLQAALKRKSVCL